MYQRELMFGIENGADKLYKSRVCNIYLLKVYWSVRRSSWCPEGGSSCLWVDAKSKF